MHNEFETLHAATNAELAGPPEGPLEQRQRLPTLDILRGFALLGILLLNIEDFAGHEVLFDIPFGLAKPAFVGWHAHLDYIIVTATWLLAEGRMRILFSILFGAGTILLTERIQESSGLRRSASIFYRRNLWLLAFGLFHGMVLWFEDILVDYAISAIVVLYPLRRLSGRSLIVVGLLVSVPGGIISGFRGWHIVDTISAGERLGAARQAGPSATSQHALLPGLASGKQKVDPVAMTQTLREGRLGFIDGLPHRRAQWVSLMKYKFGSFRISEWLGAMIGGMGLHKCGYLTNKRSLRDYALVALVGYAIAVPIVLTGLWQVYRAHFTEAAVAKWILIPYSLQVIAGALANMSVLLLLIRYKPSASIFRALSAVGRTAFTNYMLTTIVC